MHLTQTELVLTAAVCVLTPLALILGSKALSARRYRKAAESGSIEAQLNLGWRCAAGFGVSQDYIEAYKWLTLAAERASGLDQTIYTRARDTAAKEMGPDQIAEAQKRAQQWRESFERQPAMSALRDAGARRAVGDGRTEGKR
jgi:TPR repeat protein